MLTPAELEAKLAVVRLLAMDVDGVLTDGRIVWIAGPDGSLSESRAFDVKDGLGISLARACGIRIAWISGRASALVAQRARELHVDHLRQGVRDKGADLLALCEEEGIGPAETAFLGDDLNDIPAFRRAGVRIAVADAATEARDAAEWITSAPGGRGAVREVVEAILKARGGWEESQERFLAALVAPGTGFDPLPGAGQ
jgi:3-deoxy-D-manno-octulosonate 8-phosphate phosphatase (KDO 8-P phosphatase)